MIHGKLRSLQDSRTPLGIAPTLGDEGEERHVLACRAFTPPGKRIDTEAASRRVDQKDNLQDDQEHVGPGPFARRVVKSEPEIDRHQRAKRRAETGNHAENQRYRYEYLDG